MRARRELLTSLGQVDFLGEQVDFIYLLGVWVENDIEYSRPLRWTDSIFKGGVRRGGGGMIVD